MKTFAIKNIEHLLVDAPHVSIPLSQAAWAPEPAPVLVRQLTTPISALKIGKFRRIFNRHTIALR